MTFDLLLDGVALHAERLQRLAAREGYEGFRYRNALYRMHRFLAGTCPAVQREVYAVIRRECPGAFEPAVE